MEVVCLEEEAFYTLIEKVVERLKAYNPDSKVKWISDEDAMKRLTIKSKTSLQKLKNEGEIRYSQPFTKVILYDVDSIDAYLERKASKNS